MGRARLSVDRLIGLEPVGVAQLRALANQITEHDDPQPGEHVAIHAGSRIAWSVRGVASSASSGSSRSA